jgi:nitric oxide reductase subunit B
MRVVGDTIFALGILGIGWFVVGLKTGWSVSPRRDVRIESPAEEPMGATVE